MPTSIEMQQNPVKHLAVAAMLIVCIAVASAILIQEVLADGRQSNNGIGSGGDDWWTTNPAQSSSSGSVVTRPQWVLDALDEKPALIYVHKGCSYCRPQTEAMAEVVSVYKDGLFCYDIFADGDARAMQAISASDPNGGVSYVPLTAIATLAPAPDWQSLDRGIRERRYWLSPEKFWKLEGN